jgi:hypothetical protein
MVSSSMQGGCPCENASLLRIGTGNVELTALFAPRPQGMTAADDWTREMLVPGKGFPELKKLYTMYGKPDHVMCGDLLRFKHNYNVVTRELMYDWFNRYLGFGHQGPIEEKDFKAITKEEHAVYNDEHPRPEGGDAFERKLNRWLADQSDKQLARMSADERNQLVASAWQTIIGLDDPVSPVDSPAAKDGVVSIVVRPAPDRPKETPVVANKRQIPAYTHGYNHSYFVLRAREVFARIEAAREAGYKIEVTAKAGTEAVALAACAACEKGTVNSLTLTADEFRFADITDWRDPDFVPGAVKYGDLPGLIEAVKWLGIAVEKR